MKRKKTLRKLPPITRQYYRLLGEIESAVNRLEKLAEKVESVELGDRALKAHVCGKPLPVGESLFENELAPASELQQRQSAGSELPLDDDPGPVPDEVG